MSATTARPIPTTPLPMWVLAVGCALASAAAAAVLAQLGLKGVFVVLAAAGMGLLLLFVRDRPQFTLLVMVASFQVLFHKSFSAINTETSGGAPSIYITSIDVFLLLLYGFWFAEGTLWRDLRSNLGRPLFLIPILGIVSVLPSFLASEDLLLSFSELVRMFWMYALFVYVALRLRDRDQAKLLALTLFVIAAVQFVVVVLQWKTGSSLGLSFLGEESTLGVRTLDDGEIPRPTGTVVHSDFLAALVAPVGLIAFSLAATLKRQPRLRVLSLAMVPLAAAPLVLAQTRAALVGFAIAFAALVVWNVLRRNVRMSTVVLVACAGLVLMVPFYGQIKEKVIDNLGTEQFQTEVQSRVELNDLAITMYLDHPIVGVGLNNFVPVEADYDTFGLIFAGNPVHDIYLLVLSETGLIGLAGFGATALVVIWVTLRAAMARDPMLAAIGAGIAATLLFFSIEEVLTFSLRQDMPLALMWLLAGMAAACARMARQDDIARRAVAA